MKSSCNEIWNPYSFITNNWLIVNNYQELLLNCITDATKIMSTCLRSWSWWKWIQYNSINLYNILKQGSKLNYIFFVFKSNFLMNTTIWHGQFTSHQTFKIAMSLEIKPIQFIFMVGAVPCFKLYGYQDNNVIAMCCTCIDYKAFCTDRAHRHIQQDKIYNNLKRTCNTLCYMRINLFLYFFFHFLLTYYWRTYFKIDTFTPYIYNYKCNTNL